MPNPVPPGELYGPGVGTLSGPGAGSLTRNFSGTPLAEDFGLTALTTPPMWAGTTGQSASGNIWAVRMVARKAVTASKLWWIISSAGVTLTAAQNLIGLYRENGATSPQIGTCPDQSGVWTATGVQSAVLTVVGGQSLSIAPADVLWVLMLNVGTTMPIWRAGSGNSAQANFSLAASGLWVGRQGTAQTALPSTFDSTTLTNTGTNSWGWPVLGVQ